VVVTGSGSGDIRPRVSLLGVLIDRVDRRAAVSALEGFLRDGGRHQVVTVNTDFVRIADRYPDYRELLNAADLAVPDGMPLVWLSRLTGRPLVERVAGIELVEEVCRLGAREGIGLFLLGARPGVAERAGRSLAARYAGLRITGVFVPPFRARTPEDDRAMVDAIRAAGRSILLVALGAPRQDRFIAANLAELDVPVAIGVGGTLDILAGAIPRAPQWMQRHGLEWLWRLIQEPRRLWRRYLLEDVPLVVRIAGVALRDRRPAGAL
jgi:N-acetylglucosaminyldiphosphoundecaprenol N-acetyl-beta-D-mannosaminyltransferase